MNEYENIKKELISSPKSWLITGVAGFIGSNLLEELLLLNQRVIGLDNFETGFQSNIDDVLLNVKKQNTGFCSSNFELIKGDIRDYETCKLATKSVNYVLHQAALGSVPRSIDNPLNTNASNIDGFLNMLVASKEANVDCFVYAASSSTYGDHTDLPKVEHVIGKPLSPYAVTKLVNEIYADVFFSTYGMRSIGLRYFNVFGKRQDPDGAYAAVIPKWISNMINNSEIYINGDGSTSRDFCFIDNAVQINILAATAKNIRKNEVFNVAFNQRTSLNELYSLISHKVQEKFKDISIFDPIYKDFRKGDVKHSLADITKAKELLGYKPKYNIDDGLSNTIDWFFRKLNK